MKRIFLLAAIILAAIGCSSQKTASKAEQAANIRQKIESQHYRVNVDYVIPAQGNARPLTSLYSVEIKGDTLVSYLPYFGVAYNIPYGGGKGLNFEAQTLDYSLQDNEKGTIQISFQAISEQDKYQYFIEVYDNGKAFVRVNSINRQSISFYGEIDE
ncbi:MAG: DUF4251 domain-containing protein [Dysgonamonadaceae bacterium]|jgi:hypothetical protein|nr:DUF4251 domain-containing protein [Dysgonamonadaceae bacterium]